MLVWPILRCPFFLIGQMIIPGSSYWNIGIGRAQGEVEQDRPRHSL